MAPGVSAQEGDGNQCVNQMSTLFSHVPFKEKLS